MHSLIVFPRPHRISHARAALAAATVLTLALAGCSGTNSTDTTSQTPTAQEPTAQASATQSAPASASPSADSALAVPGYQVGEIPPIPLFALPDLGLLTASAGKLTPELTTDLTSRPGITVTAARCDEAVGPSSAQTAPWSPPTAIPPWSTTARAALCMRTAR